MDANDDPRGKLDRMAKARGVPLHRIFRDAYILHRSRIAVARALGVVPSAVEGRLGSMKLEEATILIPAKTLADENEQEWLMRVYLWLAKESIERLPEPERQRIIEYVRKLSEGI